MADYVVVMYGGKVIEEAPVLEIFQIQNPYTKRIIEIKTSNGKTDR